MKRSDELEAVLPENERQEPPPPRTFVDIPRPISEHGVIGNLATAALVARDGAIDFLCWPNFDSPTVFAALLDPDKGGAFALAPVIDNSRIVQMYVPETNVLLTRFLGEDCSADLVDFMPSPSAEGTCRRKLVRRIKATRGRVRVRMTCSPRLDYARRSAIISIDGGKAIFRDGENTPLLLTSSQPLTAVDGGVTAEFVLDDGKCADFVFGYDEGDATNEEAVSALITETTAYWQRWARKSSYCGRWRSAVTRSALALKLMTSLDHGSIVAAVTFGLPESAGGVRNWDYRATWIRDASFTVYALMRLDYQEEAAAFTRWVGARARACDDGSLKIMYKIDGSDEHNESSLDHLAGYGGARPIRIGNDAAGQLQLDIYGELLDSVYISNKYGEAIPHAGWLGVRRVVDYVCTHWQDPDAGIWEVRSEPRQHLHSQLMCWVAVDRAIRLAQKRSLAAPFESWVAARNAISDSIWTDFWNAEKGHFVKAKGDSGVDGAMLMMPLVRFVGATDPAWLATLDAIGTQLADDCLVMRYRDEDGLTGKEGSFAACSFWFVECLARAGRLEEARLHFEKLLLYGNHLQLYPEELDTRGEFLGNFPQAFTHLALISAAFYLDRALDGKYSEWRA